MSSLSAAPATPRPPAATIPAPHPGLGFRGFVGLIAALMAMAALAIDTMLPALPAIGESLGVADENARQWIVTAFLLGFGAAQIVYGPLSDRYGRRPVLLFGIGCYVLCGIATALSTSFAMLLAARTLQGMSVAATRVVTVSVVRDCYGGRQMARVMSLAFMVFLAAPVLAPTIGQGIMLVFPWRGLFALLAVYGAVMLGVTWQRLPETLHPEYRRPFSPAAILSGVRRAIGSRQASGYMLTQTALTGALFGFINSVQQIFAHSFHRPAAMPLVFAAIAGMMAVASLLNARIVERLGMRRVAHGALIGFVALEALHLAVVLSLGDTMASFALFQALTMFCFGLCVGNLGALAMEPLAEVAGIAASVQGLVTTMGGALLGLWVGQNFDGSTLPMTLGFVGFGALSLLLVLATERGRLFGTAAG